MQLGLGIVTTGGGLLLTLAGGGSEIASVGSSSAISIPVATEGIAIAGTGLAISGPHWRICSMYGFRNRKVVKVMGRKNAEQENNKEYKKPKRGSGKEKANDVPSWARGEKPYKNENGKQFADRLLDEKYGKGNYSKG